MQLLKMHITSLGKTLIDHGKHTVEEVNRYAQLGEVVYAYYPREGPRKGVERFGTTHLTLIGIRTNGQQVYHPVKKPSQCN
ncbi:MAG: hypothetical protein ACRCR2_02605 [Fusobacteriaceae bacterium]